MPKPLYYSDYLELNKILDAQHPKSESVKEPVHDEMLFIIVHQAFELWFRQIIHELDYVREQLQNKIDDNSETMALIVQRLQRVIKIFNVINQQFDILETMTPLDFLEFRNLLYPASGFQSRQFREIEAKIGLIMNKRHAPEEYKKFFTGEDFIKVNAAETSHTIFEGLKGWLSRMPFLAEEYWNDYEMLFPHDRVHKNKFLSDYFNLYAETQREGRDKKLLEEFRPDKKEIIDQKCEEAVDKFKELFLEKGTEVFSGEELTSILFIMLYRQYPLLRFPFSLLNSLMEIDELMSMWRYKHYLMVKKMIGLKPGTGGSLGAAYLEGALKKNNVFYDLTMISTYYLERDKLPKLPQTIKDKLTFSGYAI